MKSPDMTGLVALIKEFEGCKLKAYKCPSGVWTCGWGSTGPDVDQNTVWTQEQADARMEKDMNKFMELTVQLSPVLRAYPNKWQAVADFVYNCGPGAYQKSTLRKMVNAEDWDAAVGEFKKWTKGGGKVLTGLVRRREEEIKLFLSRA